MPVFVVVPVVVQSHSLGEDVRVYWVQRPTQVHVQAFVKAYLPTYRYIQERMYLHVYFGTHKYVFSYVGRVLFPFLLQAAIPPRCSV